MHKAISVEQISKRFLLRDHRQRTIRESLTRLVTGRFSHTTSLWALRDVSFEVNHGTTFGIIGHNGAGKSTLLRLLCGLSRPTKGRIIKDGRISGILELGGGFSPNLTGRQNLVTAGILNGLSPTEVKRRADKIIAFAELERFIDQPTRTYSSGMYLRLAFAAAMEFEPSVLVLDEVLAVGDERFQAKCMERITDLKRAGTTLIITSHNPEEIQSLCDEVVVLEEGQIVMQGDPKRALASYHDLLRQRTEARAANLAGTKAPAPLATHNGTRQGTFEASFSSVTLLDLKDRPAEKVESGEGLRIKLMYHLSQLINDLALLVSIYNENHVKCFETAVTSMASTFGTLSSESTVLCTIKSMPLLPGRYFVNVGLYPTDWSFIYDYHWQMHPFYITAGERNQAQGSGVVAMETTWASIKGTER
jgi:lipopolysaccharide transport system ATP-binding protein